MMCWRRSYFRPKTEGQWGHSKTGVQLNDVLAQVILPAEDRGTVGALKDWPFPCVFLPMPSHATLLCEPHVANVTLIWLLPSVNITDVPLQVHLKRSCVAAVL